jgi:hypothetical protein
MQKNYDFKKVDVIVGGRQMAGWADGDDAISIEFDANLWETTVGAAGEVTRSKTNNLTATIKLKLQSTSDSNDILNGFYLSDLLSNAGSEPFLMKDQSGREICAAESCWVEKPPQIQHGQKVGVREWTLKTDRLVVTYGGN